MSTVARLIAQFQQQVANLRQEDVEVDRGLLRDPSGIGTSKHNIEPHPSAAPYPYIVDAGHGVCVPDGPCKCYPDGNWDPGQ